MSGANGSGLPLGHGQRKEDLRHHQRAECADPRSGRPPKALLHIDDDPHRLLYFDRALAKSVSLVCLSRRSDFALFRRGDRKRWSRNYYARRWDRRGKTSSAGLVDVHRE